MKIKKHISAVFMCVLAGLFAAGHAHAQDIEVALVIEGPESVLLNTLILVPETCDVQHGQGEIAKFAGFLAICALQSAMDTGAISEFAVTDWGFGFSLDSISGIANAQDWSELWVVWHNESLAEVGIDALSLSQGDTLSFVYGPFPDPESPGPEESVEPKNLDVEKAVSFLLSFQDADGSILSPFYSDWAAIALGAVSGQQEAKAALSAYLKKNISPGSLITDYERRGMALLALNMSPYQVASNYASLIEDSFDGTQLGDPGLVNDDIFGLLVLAKSGYGLNTPIIEKTTSFIISSQDENGSWDNLQVDMSAAAMQALSLVPSLQGVPGALKKAREFLASQQKETGGFGNIYSTSWAMQAIAAQGESQETWIKGGKTPGDVLFSSQAPDGGLLEGDTPGNRVWATSYAIPAALQRSWGSILSQFPAPVFESSGGGFPAKGGGGGNSKSESPILQASLQSPEENEPEAISPENRELEPKKEGPASKEEQLKEIEQELNRIASELEVLQFQVAELYSVYLAQKRQDKKSVVVLPVPSEIKESSSLAATSDGIISVGEEHRFEQGQDKQQLTAGVSGTFASRFFSSYQGQALLVLGAGIFVFFILGGWKLTFSFLPKRSLQPRALQEPPF